MAALDEIREARLGKLALLRESGMDPYPARITRDLSLKDLRENFDSNQSENRKVTVAGRIMAIRGQGAILFVVLDDGTDRFQSVFKKDTIAENLFTLFTNAIDIGDFISVTGTLFTTERGEKSILCESWSIVTKSLLPLPEKWHGITDDDERYRKRYLDILMNPELREIFKKRSKFWNVIREYLLSKDFIEVETPVLENTTGGADARPFVTHHNALDIDVYLRISAGELWQKKLLVAGFPKTFEIGRIFRNEGMSAEHLQDYTQLEYYMAYSDFKQGMEMTKELYRLIGEKVFGTTKFTIKGFEIDLANDWQIYDFVSIIDKEYGIDALNTTVDQIESALKKYDIKYEASDVSVERGVDLLWKRVRKTIGGPGFLINVPVYLEPLAKKNPENLKTVERFQVILAGSEMGKGFSELNDPVDQKERFMAQQALRDAGDDEAQMADMEFVEALEHGMPPAFGFGLSERLFSFLIDKPVRETVLFPLMKPKEELSKKDKEIKVAVALLNSSAELEAWQIANTVAHLTAAFGARSKSNLFKYDSVTTGDKHPIKLNIQHAIMIKNIDGSDEIRKIIEEANNLNLEVSEFTREMLETTNDNKVLENTKAKNYKDIDFLGVLIFGSKSEVDSLTKDFKLFS